MKKENSKIRDFIAEICKGKTEEELEEAEYNFKEYLVVVKDICDRLEREGREIVGLDEDLQD